MADINNPPLNVQPIGLLDFFQLKNGGQYPQTLGTVLAPTYDLRDHYLQVNAAISDVPRALATADNAFVSFDTPQTWWRYINFFAWTWTPANALDAWSGWPVLRPIDDTTQFVLLPFLPSSGGNNTNRFFCTAGAVLRRVVGRTTEPFFVPPGYEIGLLQFDGVSTAGAATMKSRISGLNFRA